VAGVADPSLPCETFHHPTYTECLAEADRYSPYNRIVGLRTWLDSGGGGETLLLLDPDCVFLAPVLMRVRRGAAVTQAVGHMDIDADQELVLRHCRRPDAVQPVATFSTFIHRDDLQELLPAWLEKTLAIRADSASRSRADWIADMWGYAFAAAELGLQHELRPITHDQWDDARDRPLIHYCQASASPDRQWSWDKRTYRPWERVPSPPPGTPLASVELIRLLNEYVELQS
jgi:hypothetical protein